MAVSVKTILPKLPEPSTAVTNFCAIPELFLTPMPLRVSVNSGLAITVNGFVAAEVNMMPVASMSSEIERLVVFERANVATSAGQIGRAHF